MIALFWKLSADQQRDLMQYQWDNFKEKLDIPDEPKQAPTNHALEPEADQELVREMQLTPHSPRHTE